MRPALALLVLLTACGDYQHPRRFPRWAADAAEVQWRGCLGVRAFVRRSGKQGVGVALELRSRHDCAATLPAAALALDDGGRHAGEPPALTPLMGRTLRYAWMPVRFDGDRAFNRGARRGELVIDVAIDGVALPPVRVPVHQVWDGLYEARR